MIAGSPTPVGFVKSSLSLVDDVGELLISDNIVLRIIRGEYASRSLDLIKSGLIDELVRDGLFPETVLSEKYSKYGDVVLEHQLISPTIYPYEWSPEMLRQAALCVLEVNERANKYGYELKDAHPYNVMFWRGSPQYVDFGSFVVRRDNKIWMAYDEFNACYCSALKVAEKGYELLFRQLYIYNGTALGDELMVLSRPLLTILGLKLTKKIYRYIRAYVNGPLVSDASIRMRFQKPYSYMIAKFILNSNVLPRFQQTNGQLYKKIISYKLNSKTTWGDYHDRSGFYDSKDELRLTKRFEWVLEKVKQLSPNNVLELAGNQGVLSLEMSRMPGIEMVICSDYDQSAIDCLAKRPNKKPSLYYACFDFMGDVRERISNERSGRLQCDLVIALAVTHHLVLTQKYYLDSVFSTILKYTKRHVIVEFMPLGLWDGVTATEIPDWYNESNFRMAMSKYFNIIDRVHIERNRVIYVGERN